MTTIKAFEIALNGMVHSVTAVLNARQSVLELVYRIQRDVQMKTVEQAIMSMDTEEENLEGVIGPEIN